jgi:hypothetical protein
VVSAQGASRRGRISRDMSNGDATQRFRLLLTLDVVAPQLVRGTDRSLFVGSCGYRHGSRDVISRGKILRGESRHDGHLRRLTSTSHLVAESDHCEPVEGTWRRRVDPPSHSRRTFSRRFFRRIELSWSRHDLLLAPEIRSHLERILFLTHRAAGAASVRQGRGWTKGRAKTKSTKSSSNSRHADAERSPRAESALARLLSPSFSLFLAASRVVLLRPPSADVRRLSRVFPENRVPRACLSRDSRKNLLALAARDPSHARVAPN